jgi:uncharacterized coiled-coil DUF342 family protein
MNEQQEAEFEKINEEINQIRTEYRNAKKILQDIISFNETIQSSKVLFDSLKNESQTSYDFIQKQKEEINSSTILIQSQVTEITTNLQKVKTDIDNMQTAYGEFSETKGRVSGVSGEIETLLATSRSLYSDISIAKDDAQKVLLDIKTTYQTVVENIQTMQTAYQEFLNMSSKLNDPKTGLQAIFDIVQSINKQSNSLLSEMKTFRDNSRTFLSEIEQNKKKTDELKDAIQSNFQHTESKKTQIENATGLIIDASFAQTFKIRQKEIEDGLYSWHSWKNIFLMSVFILIILVILPFIKVLNFGQLTWYELFLNRVFYTSPVLFLIAYSAIQYSKERDLAEKYAFKATSSAAIRSHVDYLAEKFSSDSSEQVVLEFAKETFSIIYKEPYATHDNLEERIEKLEGDADISTHSSRTNINEMVKNVKELKGLLPETGIFEKVMSIISNISNKK